MTSKFRRIVAERKQYANNMFEKLLKYATKKNLSVMPVNNYKLIVVDE